MEENKGGSYWHRELNNHIVSNPPMYTDPVSNERVILMPRKYARSYFGDFWLMQFNAIIDHVFTVARLF